MDTFAEQHGDVPMVTPPSFTLTRCPARPRKERTAFWPGTGPVLTETGVPPGETEAVASGGTS
jgi:hypothetical protein